MEFPQVKPTVGQGFKRRLNLKSGPSRDKPLSLPEKNVVGGAIPTRP
jgi:hypothetical protein